MGKSIFITFVLSLIFSYTFAQVENSTKSEYKEGRYFETHSTCIVNAPIEQTSEILNQIFEGLKKNPTRSLKWAFDGLGKAKTADENVQLIEKSVIYDPNSSLYIVNLLMIKDEYDEIDIKIEGQLKNVKFTSGRQELCLSLKKKVKVLNDFLITITAIPREDNTTVLLLHSKIKFGFIVDMFFTQNRYKNIIEWRLAEFLNNIKKKTETSKSYTCKRK